jgi:4-hydroxy-4-methyl-2-oxoglutarate aldolase
MAGMNNSASGIHIADFEVGTQDISVFAEQRLYTAVVSDSLDQIGMRSQAMREYLRPLFPTCKFAGWARTIACSDVYHISDDPYDLEIEALSMVWCAM